MFWTTELYSLGRCYREWLGWPERVPIPAYGDHGVTMQATLQPHELENRARVHFTFNRRRWEANRNLPDRRLVHVMHPWIRYRRSHQYAQRTDAQGTLVFFTHSIPGIDIEGYDYVKYFSDLRSLPTEFHPLVVCMHMHDIRKGSHHLVQDLGLPVVTAGETASPWFIDRFYDLLTRFRYATSNKGGSDIHYSTELGIAYFIFGDEPRLINRSHDQNKRGKLTPPDALAREYSQKVAAAFRGVPVIGITDEQRAVSAELLGLDAPENGALIRRMLTQELFRLTPRYLMDRWRETRRTADSKTKG